MGGWRNFVLLRDELLELVAVMLAWTFVLGASARVATILHVRLLRDGAAIGARWRPTGIVALSQRRTQIAQMPQIPQMNGTDEWEWGVGVGTRGAGIHPVQIKDTGACFGDGKLSRHTEQICGICVVCEICVCRWT
jgi:hypothetical protein